MHFFDLEDNQEVFEALMLQVLDFRGVIGDDDTDEGKE